MEKASDDRGYIREVFLPEGNGIQRKRVAFNKCHAMFNELPAQIKYSTGIISCGQNFA